MKTDPLRMLHINHKLSIPLHEFSFSFSRSGGPGGQNVNKVNTKVTMKWPVAASSLPEAVKQRFQQHYPRRINQQGELVLTSQRYRDQGRNVTDCLDKLRDLVAAVALPPKTRKATKPTRGSQQRRLEEKKKRARQKQARQRKDWDK